MNSYAGLLLLLLAATPACVHRGAFAVPRAPAPLPAHPAVRLEPAPPAGPLGVDAAVRLALARNPDIGTARARLAAARAGLAAARAALLPVLAVDASYLRGDAPSAFLFKSIDARNLQPGTDFNHPGDFWNVEAGTTLRWNVWNGGRDRLGVWAGEAAVDARSAEVEAVRNALVAGVVGAMLDIRAATELQASDDASIRSVTAQVEETRKKVEEGSVLRSDLLSLEVRLAEARERRIRTGIARRQGLATLRHLLALPADTPLEIEAVGGVEAQGLPERVADALASAYRSRPELVAARRAVQRGVLELERAQRGRLPRADLEARYFGDDEGLSLDGNWTLALAVTFDAWDGGRRRAAVRAARAALDQLHERDRRALLDVSLDVERAYLQLEETRARVDVARQAVAAADETLRLVEQQYRAGVATVTRFLEAEAARTQARTAWIRARLDLDRAKINARRAIGWLGREEP